MSVLAAIQNIKIPYATEGVVRTAQLDDTIAPQDSVQLAVNMNFDRVGAIQTRPGVTSYADILADGINSYGTLRNEIIPAGYNFIFQLGSNQEISNSPISSPVAVKLSDTKIAIFWTAEDGTGYARNFSIDEATGSVTGLGVPLQFETDVNSGNKAVLMDDRIVINTWTGTGGAVFAAGFNTIDDQITVGTPYQFDTSGFEFSLIQLNTLHALCFYAVGSGDGVATVFAINLTTLVITEPGTPLTFATGGTVRYNSSHFLGDGTHYMNFWSKGGVGNAQSFTVNTSTWAITAVGSPLTFGTGITQHNLMSVGDGQHFVDAYLTSGVSVTAQAFSVNLSTFAVTTVGTSLTSFAFVNGVLTAAPLGDGQHFVLFYSINSGDGHVQMINMSVSTFDITAVGNNLSGFDFGNSISTSSLNIATNQVMTIWGGTSSLTGKAAMFRPFGNVVDGRWLYAGSGAKVYNTSNGTWTQRRGGLAQVSRPRYSQYLNYIWMVNGNEQIGGDPIATSNGGNFGTDLIPNNFPRGDFIHAGFEGRVWVANKTLGVIYYTDIVQFIPPSIYILTYNPAVNFISQLTPQTGQSITALYRVPRALLVFTEDSIFRIYGATSVDAYPGYNVGTFSQESIIETKTGIFFHHSSGFYQFDYGSQPVEISRRIIDFVKAIPRSNYGDIEGVYDGFDNVEWAVGSVTVEGVVFSNCVLRYTISTQVWTIYDYVGNTITAMIFYDDGVNLNHLMGTEAGKTGALDTGVTDFGEPFYYEFIDRWRSFANMYYQTKSLSGFNVYSENAAGANLLYQKQKQGPNAWLQIGTVSEENTSLMPNATTEDFDVMRLRLAGTTSGTQVVVHGIEIVQLTIKGQDEN